MIKMKLVGLNVLEKKKTRENEAWRAIEGTCGKYLISDKGRIKKANGREVTQCNDKDGYKVVNLWMGRKRKKCSVHRLVAQTFKGMEDREKMKDANYTIDHINKQKDDNRIENLRVITRTENVRLARNKNIIKCDRNNVVHGFYNSMQDAADANNIPRGSMTYIVNTKKEVDGFTYRVVSFDGDIKLELSIESNVNLDIRLELN